MSCLITSGYTKTCDAPGGVRRLLFINYADIDTLTIANGAVSTLTLKTNKSAFAYNVEREVTKCEVNTIGTQPNGSHGYEQKVSTKIHGFDQLLLAQMDLLAKARVIVITENNDGQFELFFSDKGCKPTIKRVNDAEYSGFNGFEIEMSMKQATGTAEVSSTIINSLTIV